jgi:hypothetical protein
VNFVKLIWASALLLPLMFKPSPITYWGEANPAVNPIPLRGSGYDPTPVPSDSAWTAQGDSVRASRDESHGEEAGQED